MSGPRGRAVAVGDVMTDVIVRPDGPLVRGGDRAATIRTLPGGSGANQAAWLGHFGVDVAFAARVGAADAAACAMDLRRFGVAPYLAADATLPTGTLVSLVDADGERSFLTDRGANDALCGADLPDHLLEGAALLHVSGYALFSAGPRAAVLHLIARARRRDVPVSIDPASISVLAAVGPSAFLDWTAGAALFCANDAEAALLAGTRERPRQRRLLAETYGDVLIKRGPEGAELLRGDSFLSFPAPRVAVLDTTGAGDAFLGAFIAGRLAGADPTACLEAAIAAGASATTVFGGRPPHRQLDAFAGE